jgi:hypothetical protein
MVKAEQAKQDEAKSQEVNPDGTAL